MLNKLFFDLTFLILRFVYWFMFYLERISSALLHYFEFPLIFYGVINSSQLIQKVWIDNVVFIAIIIIWVLIGRLIKWAGLLTQMRGMNRLPVLAICLSVLNRLFVIINQTWLLAGWYCMFFLKITFLLLAVHILTGFCFVINSNFVIVFVFLFWWFSTGFSIGSVSSILFLVRLFFMTDLLQSESVAAITIYFCDISSWYIIIVLILLCWVMTISFRNLIWLLIGFVFRMLLLLLILSIRFLVIITAIVLVW